MQRQPDSRVYISKASMLALEIMGEPTRFGRCSGRCYTTQESCLKAYMDGHPISQPTAVMLTLHPEEVDPFISLAMLWDYLSLADANCVVKVSRLDQVHVPLPVVNI